MNKDKRIFSDLVNAVMTNTGLSAMRPVVEKELLHYEIFRALDAEGLLKNLVFQGGTSLRLCRGSDRFSEDLDFAGGEDFSAHSMEKIKTCVEAHIAQRFGLNVTVSNKRGALTDERVANVKLEKWWISIETAPDNPAMPRQRIKLEIANIPAHTRELMPLRINYDALIGMPTVLVTTETLSEIMADKVLAFPTSLIDKQGLPVSLDSSKIRHRDIWDLAWMIERGVLLDSQLVVTKIKDYQVSNYDQMLELALEMIPAIVKSNKFKDQMKRFLDSTTIAKTLAHKDYIDYLARSVTEVFVSMKTALSKQ